MTWQARLFQQAADGVEPQAVPQVLLHTGATMPAIGLGTFGSDHAAPGEVAEAVLGAAEVGYRHFDCAMVYGNEAEIGRALQAVMAGGVSRQELWVTSKLWNNKHAEADVIPTCRQSLADLQLDYLDLYLIHWPFPNHHEPGVDVHSRSGNARPYIHEAYMRTWRQMEKLVDLGLVRHIGTSNMTIPKLELVLRDARIQPAANEMELHPHFQQPELFEYVRAHGIVPVGYSPLGSPNRPERDRTPGDTVDIEDPVVVRIAAAHGVHPALVCIKWAVQRGQVPIPMSTRRRNYLSNLRAVTEDPLTPDEMAAMAAIDRNCRLIKGQVFLWREGQSWEDLWDLDGQIAL
jgi:diketogulonate reductase-like aldo/keto reductase